MTSELDAQGVDAVVVEDLVKRYRKNPVAAVDGVSFAVRSGEVFGLLGPNGAGKTTTIGVLTTRVLPTSGRAYVSGIDVLADPVGVKRHLAVVPQRNNLDRSLSIRQNLLFHAAYHGVGKQERVVRAEELLDRFGLAERAGERVEMFSGGQMQRVMIARALMHSPEVLFLDEPTTGLDPAARLFLWDQIRELRAGGRTVVLTTHDMEEAASLCDRVGIVDKGHLLVLDTPQALSRSLPGQSALEIGVEAPDEGTKDTLLARIAELDAVVRVEQLEPDRVLSPAFRARLYLGKDAGELIKTITDVITSPAKLTDLRTVTPSLEDVFLHLTGRLLR
ncbi:MAG: ABC transporter ATP-binding protein [Jatrophihabitans sp.]